MNDSLKKIYKYIDDNKSVLISNVQKLVRIPTVNPPGSNYQDMIKSLEDICSNVGLTTRRLKVSNSYLKKNNIMLDSSRINLLANFSVGRDKKTLHFNGHYDVVPVLNESLWKHNPFSGHVDKTKVYGRGTDDMKGTIASMLFAFEAILKTSNKPYVNIEYSFVPDEETGSHAGFRYLVCENLINPDYAIGEGSGGINVSHGNNGVLWIEITLEGKAAHASVPHTGINAFEDMVKISNELITLKNKIEKRESKYLTCTGVHGKSSLVLGGVCEGGIKVNVVPNQIKFSIDRRIIPEETVASAKKEIHDIIEKLKPNIKSKIKIEYFAQDTPVVISTDSHICRCADNAIKNIFGKHAVFTVLPCANDIRFFDGKKTQFIGYSPGGLKCAHVDNEYVEISALVSSAKFYAYMMKML